MTTDQQEAVSRKPADRVGYLLTSWVDYLPHRIRRLVPKEFAGYTIISLVTFVIDMGLLALLRHRMDLPVSLSVAISYVVGFTLNYILNRTLNFQSHAPLPGQLIRYCIVVVADFAETIGVTVGLNELGVELRASRMIAGSIVGVATFFLYRWWVFRR